MTVDQLPGWLLVDDYLLPGIALVLLFGMLPIAAVVQLVRRRASGWTLTTAVGLLLVFWMLAQIAAIGLAFPALQTGFLMGGIVLTGLGLDGGTSVGDVGTTSATGARP